MKCKNCGAYSAAESTAFCQHCGEAFVSAKKAKSPGILMSLVSIVLGLVAGVPVTFLLWSKLLSTSLPLAKNNLYALMIVCGLLVFFGACVNKGVRIRAELNMFLLSVLFVVLGATSICALILPPK